MINYDSLYEFDDSSNSNRSKFEFQMVHYSELLEIVYSGAVDCPNIYE